MADAHFEAGPSALTRVIACPGSVVASRGLPDSQGRAAAHGESLHSLLEICLKTRKTPDAFPTDDEWAIYTDADRDAVTSVVTYVRDLCSEYPGDLLVESSVDMQALWPGMFGKVDVAIVSARTLIILDAKFGRIKVDAHTAQLKAYALGLLLEFDYLDFDTVICIIAQPFIENFDEVRYTPIDLRQWSTDVMIPALTEAFGPAPRFNPTPDGCRFCRANGRCSVRKAVDYDSVATLLNATPDVALLTPDELGALLQEFPKFEAVIADVKTYAIRELIAGRPIPGHKLIEGRSVRKWADPAAAPVELAAALCEKRPALAPADALALVTTTAPINLTAAEKLIGKSNFVFQRLTVKPQGRPTLAPESDTRPAYLPGAAVIDALDAIEF